MSHLRVVAAAVLSAVTVVGCAAQTPAAQTPQSQAPGNLLAKHELAGLSATQIVDKLDRSESDRTQGPIGSVRGNELVLTEGPERVALPIEDRFYLSIAPYVSKTHDCFNHNLATCKGELANQALQVTITDDAGKALVDEQAATYANGFVGFWLPKDSQLTVKVDYQGKTGQAHVKTGAADPTCLTTLKLT